MPFTPYHFGPGILAKSIAPSYFSFVAFVGTQVAIDLESLYNLLRHEWPVHRFFHSLAGAVLAGSGVAIVIGVAGRLALPRLARVLPRYHGRLS